MTGKPPSKSDGKPRDLYAEAGVDAEKGDALVDWLQDSAKSPCSPYGQSVSGIGGFAALFKADLSRFKEPLLISCTDGVGTKLLLGLEHHKLEGLGIDLVAMCVNDLYTLGGHPLFFLDYYATGALQDDQFKAVLTGIRGALTQCRAELLGGETAELPGLYEKGHFDLAGFMVGIVEKSKVLGPEQVRVGDRLIALPSSGFHSNGYSLIRKWLSSTRNPSAKLMQQLLEPTRIYSEIPDLAEQFGVEKFHAAAHITGGGISGNLPRVLPDGCTGQIKKASLPTPEWMRDFIVQSGSTVDDIETVFNLGVGMICVVADSASESFINAANKLNLNAAVIGEVIKGRGPSKVVYT